MIQMLTVDLTMQMLMATNIVGKYFGLYDKLLQSHIILLESDILML